MNEQESMGIELWYCQRCATDNVCKEVDWHESKKKIVICENCKSWFKYVKEAGKEPVLTFTTNHRLPKASWHQ